ncbi:MAG: sigma-70 family RNA polymerase sigma factor [Opitutales bacterium]|nr:sigma-70 family RNA polymerase sigma factor [Opitutales bacterium]
MAFSRAVGQTVETEALNTAQIDEDLALVRSVQEGDSRAFDALTRKYRERIFSIVYNITANREDAADLTQEAFIRAFTSIARFKGKSSFFTWLYRIAVNATLSHVKRHRMRRFFSFENINEEMAPTEIVEVLAHKHAGDRSAGLSELQEKLNEALQKLSPKHRTVVILFEIEGLNHQEIAQIMKTSEGTVRSRLHYAKQELQAFLQDYVK